METSKYDISKLLKIEMCFRKVFCNRMTWSTFFYKWKFSIKLIVKGENRIFVNFSYKKWSKNAFLEQITHAQLHIEKKLLELATSFFFYLIGNFLRNKIGLMYFFCKIRSNRDNCKKLIFNAKSATLLESGNPKIWLERFFFIFTSKRTNPKNLLLVSQKKT